MTTKTAQNGDCLCNIAAEAGFLNCEPLRAEPKNSAFLDRPLQDGDEVTIPDVRPRLDAGATDNVHKFVLKTAPPTSIRFVHGSPDIPYLEDETVPASGAGLDISSFVTNLGGSKERDKFPDQFEFHQEGHVDPATFKVEVVDPLAGASVKVLLEAMKPVYKKDGTVDHHETFAGAADADLRKIDKLDCAKVRSGVAYRSKYLRLVVDELDKKTVEQQTLLVTDMADGLNTDNDKVEILDQQVRASYTLARCTAPDPNKCTIITQAPIGNDRKRIKLTVHIFKSLQIPAKEQDVRRRVKKWFRRVYAQANMSPKFMAPEVEFLDSPPNNMLVVSQDHGNSSSGVDKTGAQSKLSFDLFTAPSASPANFTADGSVSIKLDPAQSPETVAAAIQKALPQGFKAELFKNPTAFNSTQPSEDVLITKDDKIVDVRNEVTDDTKLSIMVARVDVNKVPIDEGIKDPGFDIGINGSLSARAEHRRVIRAAPGKGDRLEVYVIGFMGSRDRPFGDRKGSGRGTTITPGTVLDKEFRPDPPLGRTILLASFTQDSTDDDPFVLAHEAGHALMDANHVDDPKEAFTSTDPVLKSQLMLALVSDRNAVDPKDKHLKTLADVTKRLSNTRLNAKDSSVEPMLVTQRMSDPAAPRSRETKVFQVSEVARLRDKGAPVLEDW